MDVVRQFVLVQDTGIRQSECTGFHGGNNVVVPAGFELRTAGFDIQRSGTAKVLGGLKDFALLPVIQGYFFHILQRELTQVHRSILGITDFYTIIEHTQMMCAHRADIHRFETAYAAIILDLHAGEVTQGIRHAVGAQTFQFGAFQTLHRYNRLIG